MTVTLCVLTSEKGAGAQVRVPVKGRPRPAQRVSETYPREGAPLAGRGRVSETDPRKGRPRPARAAVLSALSLTGGRKGKELQVLATPRLEAQHRHLRAVQDHHPLPHGLRLLRHHGPEDEAPAERAGADHLAPAVHRLARARLSRGPQGLSV